MGEENKFIEKMRSIAEEKQILEKIKGLIGDTAPKFVDILSDVLNELIPEGGKLLKNDEKSDKISKILKLTQEQLQLQQNDLKNMTVILREIAKKTGLTIKLEDPGADRDGE